MPKANKRFQRKYETFGDRSGRPLYFLTLLLSMFRFVFNGKAGWLAYFNLSFRSNRHAPLGDWHH